MSDELPESIREIFKPQIMIENHKIYNVSFAVISVEKSLVTGRYFSMVTYTLIDADGNQDKSITLLTAVRSDELRACAVTTACSLVLTYPIASKAEYIDSDGKFIDFIDISDELDKLSKGLGRKIKKY